MHRKFPAIQQNQRNSILFHETIPLKQRTSKKDNIGDERDIGDKEIPVLCRALFVP
jgi:hypothetical protein